ncbi:MAG: hypothetical protein HC916_13460 [Coleofasciculaceae cyanobacterium SM2_1_6]|nr:hypothetical protein [Coleofasciculaceae cyanobacterium SM2_1_6]
MGFIFHGFLNFLGLLINFGSILDRLSPRSTSLVITLDNPYDIAVTNPCQDGEFFPRLPKLPLNQSPTCLPKT